MSGTCLALWRHEARAPGPGGAARTAAAERELRQAVPPPLRERTYLTARSETTGNKPNATQPRARAERFDMTLANHYVRVPLYKTCGRIKLRTAKHPHVSINRSQDHAHFGGGTQMKTHTTEFSE